MLKGWTAYHLSLVAIFAACVLFLGINALVMMNSGGYETSAEAELPYSDRQLWSWISENDKRIKWQVGTYDISKLRGDTEDIDSSRMLFFRAGLDKWNGVEFTLEATAPLKWKSRQELPTVLRIYTVLLAGSGPCQTKVTLLETAELYDFTERFWLFWTKRDHQERLEYSLRQLKTWMGHKGEVCAAGSRLFVHNSVHDEFLEHLGSTDPDCQQSEVVAPSGPIRSQSPGWPRYGKAERPS